MIQIYYTDADIYIQEGPKSLLIPVNTNAVFTCQAYCAKRCDIDWFINNNNTANSHQRIWFESIGFRFSRLEKINMTYTVRLTVNASISINDTELWCSVIVDSITTDDRVMSHPATLLVLTGD